jgi:hypothetical protein
MEYKQFTFEYETQSGRRKAIRIVAKTVEEARGLWEAISTDDEDPPQRELVLYEPAIMSKNASRRGDSQGPPGRKYGG